MMTRHAVISLMLILALVSLAIFPSFSFACNYTFDVNLVSRVLDPVRTGNDTLGFDNWYVWKYKVDVITGSTNRALSNWVLELPNCYITSPLLFQEIEASAGWGGGDRVRIYDPEAVTDDHNTGLSGLKWDWVSGDQLNRVGEYDYFWFSVPTDVDIEVDWAVKAGQNIVRGTVEGPACPECEPPIPEPLSLLLFGSGLLRTWFSKRRGRES